MIILCLLGTAVILLKWHYQCQANSIRHKNVLSIIFIGRLMITETKICLTSHDISAAWEQLILIQQHS